MARNKIDKEKISAGKFEVKFKNALRDYYSYGFKTYKNYEGIKHRSRVHEEWTRLNNILKDYCTWGERKEKRLFLSLDSRTLKYNPFHGVYQFCIYNQNAPAYFFHMITALSSKFRLRYGIDSLELKNEEHGAALVDKLIEAVRKQSKQDLKNQHVEILVGKLNKKELTESELIEHFSCNPCSLSVYLSDSSLTTSELIYYFSDGIEIKKGNNNKHNGWLHKLEELGLLTCTQNVDRGDKKWKLSNLNMKKVIEEGKAVSPDFEERFVTALDFYSRYFLLGVVGSYLLQRIGGEYSSPIRFKHEYYMQSLNDFNLYDLLEAIESKTWCYIKSRHGIRVRDSEVQLLCYPLEIRISNMTGRVFLMYYEPNQRSCTSLRLEFIESISCIREEKLLKILDIAEENVKSDIENAKRLLKYVWGVSTTVEQKNNVVEEPVKHNTIKMRITCDFDKERYILDRLERERRIGKVEKGDNCINFEVEVSDTVELRPWLRSFYSRIESLEGMETTNFTMETDIENISRKLEGLPIILQKQIQGKKKEKWIIDEAIVKKIEKESVRTRAHEKLFNEMFSLDYYKMADIFVDLCSKKEGEVFSYKGLAKIIEEKIGKEGGNRDIIMLDNLKKEFKELFSQKEFLIDKRDFLYDNISADRTAYVKDESYQMKYVCDKNVNFYRDIVPLTKLEQSWILTILEDTGIGKFLSTKEIQSIRDTITSQGGANVQKLPMKYVKYYDRFLFSDAGAESEQKFLSLLIKSINEKKVVSIEYKPKKGEIIKNNYKPIVVEYSKRDNCFRAFLQSCEEQKIYPMNISGIMEIQMLDESFDYEKAEKALNEFRSKERKVEIEFRNHRNIVDRILTEFSPWKKECEYDKERDSYRLTISYHQQDELEVVIRLMGYGSFIRSRNKENEVYKEIQSRINKQLELEKQKNINREYSQRDEELEY